jgi:hypothetical protein
VSGTGSAIAYQWQLSTDGGGTWNNIAGATNASYLVSSVTTGMNGYRYRCIVSGACNPAVISNAAILTVIATPAITNQPSSVAVCAGISATFSVSAGSVQTIIYQWQLSTDGGGTWTNIPGANSSSYSTGITNISMNAYRYRCLLSSATCTAPIISAVAILTVNASTTATWSNILADQCTNNPVLALTGGTPAGGVYSGAGVSGGNFNPSAGAGVYTLTYTYTNASGCISTASNTIVVRQQPSITLTATPLTALLPGQSTTLTAAPSPSTGGTITTAWAFNSVPLSVTGNSYVVNIEKVGAYQAIVRESWTGGLVCSNQSAIVNITALPSDKLFIFPSPNDGRFTVSYYNNGGNSTSRSIVIFDSKGARVYESKFVITGPYTLLNIDIRPAQKAIYYVVVFDAGGTRIVDGKVMVNY